MNSVCLSGSVSQYGVKLSYTEGARPVCTFSLVVCELARDGSGKVFQSFVPIMVVGNAAESCASSLEPGDLVEIMGKIGYRKGKSEKDAPGLQVTTFEVRQISTLVPPVTDRG